ncbi:TolC family protein [Ideonella azotifigens]|uniref:TolC family protein n=1 Tax=Ideonella azotifigens TaxID=513160 RepID=A0ABP3VGL4_9BURK|nr:TolC family protein [Ideonella azotifigens]MCD2342188.1 TolC family protein [Ideonella azotifigens]
MFISFFPVRSTAALAALAVLGGCASFSPDGGFGDVARLTQARSGQVPRWQRTPADEAAAQTRVTELLQQPLSAEAAVELALLHNRGLQARFAELGLAEAERVQAGRLANPALRYGRMSGGGVTEIDSAVLFNLLGLLTLPLASELGQQHFKQAKLQAASDAVAVATQARRAFFNAVAAQALVAYAQQVKLAAEASRELATRMQQAGNFNKLAQMRQQSFDADATAQLLRAQHRAVAEREQLVKALGLSSEELGKLQLPERLPDLPAQPAALVQAEQAAMDRRLDVLQARRSAEATARQLGLTQRTGFVNLLDPNLTLARHGQTGEATRRGFELELTLPLFDFGAGGSPAAVQAELQYGQAVHHAAEVAVNARSEVRESSSAYLTAHALARHYRDEVLPLQQRIADENQLRYNGMLLSVFELLADAREQITSVTGYTEALRDFWLADADLQQALAGPLPQPGQ